MFKTFYEDFEAGSVVALGSTMVDREEVIEFASKYDPQPFHLDEALAKQSVFGGLCASGWHTSAMTMSLIVATFTEQGVASMGSPGVQNLKWLKPVFPGDTLTASIEVLGKRESSSRKNLGFVETRTWVKNQKDEPVMQMDSMMMVLKTPVQEG